MVAVGSERLWKSFVAAIDLPRLSEDKKFKTNADRLAHREELVNLLAEHFKKKNSKDWLKKLESAGIPAAPIYKPEESLSDEHLLARGMIIEIEHPAIGAFKMLGNPMNFSNTPVTYRRPAPMLGEHTVEILTELRYLKKDIENFKSKKVV